MGRPTLWPGEPPAKLVNFRADRETLRAIKKLTAAVENTGCGSAQSVAIREALKAAAARLGGGR